MSPVLLAKVVCLRPRGKAGMRPSKDSLQLISGVFCYSNRKLTQRCTDGRVGLEIVVWILQHSWVRIERDASCSMASLEDRWVILILLLVRLGNTALAVVTG